MADHLQNARFHHYQHQQTLRTESPVSPLISPLYSDFPSVPQTNILSTPQRRAIERHHDAHDVSPVTMYRTSTLSRSGSVSSYSSNLTSTVPSTPTRISPPAQYVAAFGATSVVSERKRRYSDDEFDRPSAATPSHEEVDFSEKALALVNGFLDQLLYSFLGNAKSTTLTALRPAVRDVLKSRLAAEAISSADEELAELLGGGEDEDDMNQKQTVAERSRAWDTELVWRRTRLRVMVYTRLGEMEDDDEERYLRDDELLHQGDRRFSHSTGLVSWAAAIFLTSILEYIAEQVLQVSAQAAISRSQRQKQQRVSMPESGVVTPGDGLTVEEYDVEKVALNSMLGRLWRTWRKSLRGNGASSTAPTTVSNGSNHNFSRRFSRDIFGAAVSPRRSSFGLIPESVPASMATQDRAATAEEGGEIVPPEIPEEDYPEHVLAANIPLPLSSEKQDVDEIEVPGLARDPDELETDMNRSTMDPQLKRRNSEGDSPKGVIAWMASFLSRGDEQNQDDAAADKSDEPEKSATTAESETTEKTEQTEKAEQPEKPEKPVKPVLTRLRSMSVPTPAKRVIAEPKEATEDTTKSQKEDGELEKDETEPSKDTESSDAQPQLDQTAAKLPPSEDPDKSEESKDTTINSATAGSAAAAAAAASLVYGSKADKKAARNSLPANGLGLDDREAQKHLVGMKRMSMPHQPMTPQGQLAKRVSLNLPYAPATMVTTRSAENLANGEGSGVSSRPTTKSGQLSDSVRVAGEQKEKEEQKEEHDENVGIGVAQTSDAVATAPKKQEERHHNARDSFTNPAPRRQSRLIIASSSPEQPSSSDRKRSTPETVVSTTSPENFLEKRSLSYSSKAQQSNSSAQTQEASPRTPSSAEPEQAPSALATSNITNGKKQTSPTEKAQTSWRPAQSSPSEKVTPPKSSGKKSPPVSEGPSAIQEHPVVQKMAVKKQDTRAKEEDKFPLTSASIKGPEDFEMFVQGGDTVKYTLTPENVRDVAVSTPIHGWIYASTDQVQEPANTVPLAKVRQKAMEKTASSPTQSSERPPSRAGRSQTARHATSAVPIPPEPSDGTRTPRAERPRSISRPPVRNTSVHRRSGLMAREPQVVTESTRDFADFIRSTGPEKEQEIYPLVSNQSTASLHSMRNSHPHSRSSSPGAASVRSNRFSIKSGTVPPVPAVPRRKSDMQPRGATANTDSGTSELIDFIRTGPNGSSKDGQREHRISRSVAPFRTTSDSDQLQEWGDRIATQPDLKLNTSVADAPSVRSASSLKSSSYTNRTSANSRSALLNSGSNAFETTQPAYSGQQQRLSSATTARNTTYSAAPEPTIKRYRNKDPYALDFADDDEDEDFLTALPKGKREEESLIDFLRSTGPSEAAARAMAAESKTTANTPTSPTSGAAAAGPRRSSAPGFKAFGADAVSSGRSASAPKPADPIPSSFNSNNDFSAKNPTTTVAIGPITKPRPKMESLSGLKGTEGNGTGDLADFLRSSGPAAEPPPNIRQNSSRGSASTAQTGQKVKTKKSGFFAKIFERRAVGAQQGRGYLDM